LAGPVQQRFARTSKDAAVRPRPTDEAEGPLRPAPRVESDTPEEVEIELPEVPQEVLDAWEADEQAQEMLALFASEELRAKKIMSFRDVARLLESLGCDKDEFLNLFEDGDETDEEDSDEERSMGGKGSKDGDMMRPGFSTGRFEELPGGLGAGKGGAPVGSVPGVSYRGSMGGKGMKGFEHDMDDPGFSRKGGGAKGGRSKGGGRDRDFEDDDDFDFGKGKGGRGKGSFSDFDDGGFGGFGGKASKGGKDRGGKGRGKR